MNTRKFLLVFAVLLSLSGFSRQDQSPQKIKKRHPASDSFRSKVKMLADSIQKNRATLDSAITTEKWQQDATTVVPAETKTEKKESNSWLLVAAAVAVLAAFFFLFKRRKGK